MVSLARGQDARHPITGKAYTWDKDRGEPLTIPRTDLLAEIGKRVSNTKNYADAFKRAGKKTSGIPKFGKFEEQSFSKQQPLRTDLERMLQEQKGFVDVEIEA